MDIKKITASVHRIAKTLPDVADRAALYEATSALARLEQLTHCQYTMQASLLCRAEDPDTSREAAQHVCRPFVSMQMISRALEAVVHFPDKTAKELERITGYGDGSIRKRLNDLRRAGLVKQCRKRKCSVSGRTAYTWHTCKQVIY